MKQDPIWECSLDKLNQWLSLFANIGIVAGLVLVALQLQQAELFADAEQTNAEFNSTSAAQDVALAESLPDAWARARANASDLSEIELSLVDTYLMRVFSDELREQLQADRGIGSFDVSFEAPAFVDQYLGNETALRWWQSRHQILKLLTPEFTEAVDARIAELGPDLRTSHKRRIEEMVTGSFPQGIK